MIDRDLNGRTMEKDGRIDDAVRLYEANLTDKCATMTSYDRLQAIYRERLDYRSAVRVCYAFLLVTKNSADAELFQRHLQELVSVSIERPAERTVLDVILARN